MRVRALALATVLLLAAAANVLSQPDIVVGELDRPQHVWGTQILGLPLTNKADYPKYVVVKSVLTFDGTYLKPGRGTRGNYVLAPNQTMMVSVRLDIPPNYGTANVKFEVYDVVDTMDQLLASQKVMDQAMQIHFAIPAGMVPYMTERLTMTPMVDHNPNLGTEFARAMLVMMREGKTTKEIAKIAEIDTTYVRAFQDTLLTWQFLARTKSADSAVVPGFPVILAKDAEGVRPLVETAATGLAAVIEKNLPAYKRVLDSMVKGGGLAADSNDFMNGGTVLYHTYPVVTAMFLWYDLGQVVVGGKGALDVYRDTDPCNALVNQYMYGVQGGDVVNGSQYFNFGTSTGRQVIIFGDTIPTINCPSTYPWKTRLVLATDFEYAEGYQPELFTFDTSLCNPALRALEPGADLVIKPALTALKAQADKMGPNMLTQGTVLWFWNQVATKTTKKLVAKGVITRRGNGQYRFECTNGINMK
jgi:hypothetical protein